jgi:cobalt-zinc-cadmium efflux system outer membrane protein
VDGEASARRLDLLAETARRYLALSAAGHRQDIAAAEVAQRDRALAAARARFTAGASPESMALTAEAALARAQLLRDRAVQERIAARQYLAALWGEKNPVFEIAASDPLALPVIPDAAALDALLERGPELTRFASERRIGEARMQLARTAARNDLRWQLGVRRLEASDDFALVAGVSLPLGASRRAEPELRTARAGLAQLQIEHEVIALSLYATLTEAHRRYRLAQLEVQQLGAIVLPALARAVAAAERAYLGGAASLLEWTQLQAELTATRAQQLDAAFEARLALIEIQRLTGEPFLAGAGNE